MDAAAAVIGEAEQGLLPKSLVRDGQRRRRFMRQISLRHSGLFSDAAPGSLALFCGKFLLSYTCAISAFCQSSLLHYL